MYQAHPGYISPKTKSPLKSIKGWVGFFFLHYKLTLWRLGTFASKGIEVYVEVLRFDFGV